MLSLPDFKYKQIAIHQAGGNGEKLRFRADNIIIEDKDGKVIFQNTCHRLFALFIIGEMSLTSTAIKKAVDFAFPIVLMNRNMKVIAKINCGAEGNTLLRKKQYSSQERNFEIAKQLVSIKIQNQTQLLKNLRFRSNNDNEAIKHLTDITPSHANDTKELMGMEGNASKIFFASYFRPMAWQRRSPRCRQDIYNLLLDMGYTYLFNFIEAMLALYGFDLYCGVYHTFFYQRKSLVCDIIEPFRCIIDRRLRKAYNLKQIDPEDFFIQEGQYQLAWQSQSKYIRLFFKDILAEKENIFLFCQAYYRWFMRDKSVEFFPKYKIGETK